MFPLGTVLLPGELLPLRIFEPRYRQMLADCLDPSPHHSGPADDGSAARFGVVLIARGSEVGGDDIRHDVGTYAVIDQALREDDGRAVITCVGGGRFRVREWLPDAPYPRALITDFPAPAVSAPLRAQLLDLGTRFTELIGDLAAARGIPASAVPTERMPATAPSLAAITLDGPYGISAWSANLPIGPSDRQRLLESEDAAAQVAILQDAADGLEAMIAFGN